MSQVPNTSGSARIVSSDELQLRRVHKQMQARSVPRRFFWTHPLLGVALVMDFRPAGSARQPGLARVAQPAG